MGENIGKTRLQMSRCYNKHHKIAPEFKAGDLLMLEQHNARTRWPMNKLDDKKMGPFKVF
jgi:hypothetical protein